MAKHLFDRFYALEASLKAQSFSGAARQMNETTSQISRRIKALETDLGVTLCDRHRDGVTPTAAGLRFMSEMTPLIREFEALEAGLGGQKKMTLTLKTPMTLGSVLFSKLPNLLLKLNPDAPTDVPLTVTPMHDEIGLPHLTTELAVWIAETPPDADVIALRLGALDYVVVASPDYLTANGDPQQVGDLNFHPILMNKRGDLTLFQGEDEHTVKSPFTTRYDTDLSLLVAALSGAGIAVGLPRYLAQPAIDDGRLVRLLPNWSMDTQKVWLLRLPQRFPDLATQRLIVAIKTLWKDTPGCLP